MRVALISDIHGNLVALQAVLADSQRERVDQIICLGDVAGTGPQPHEVVERLRATGCPVVMGNADAWLLNPQLSQSTEETTRQIEEIDSWCAAQLTAEDKEYLRTFQPTIEVSLGNVNLLSRSALPGQRQVVIIEVSLDSDVNLLCFHGSPQSHTESIDVTTTNEALEQMLSGCHALVMAGGHTHVQMLRRFGDCILLNPGSVGLPFERKGEEAYNPPWAEYAVVAWENGRLSIELKRVPLDVAAVKQAALGSGMPYADVWAKDWISNV